MPTNLQARYDLFCVKSAVKPQPTNQPTNQPELFFMLCCTVEYSLNVFGT